MAPQTKTKPADTKKTGAGRPEGSPNKTPDTSDLDVTAIENGAVLAMEELIRASTPQRDRSPQQLAMDGKAQKSYDAWVQAGRPAVWSRVPVITYFVKPENAEAYTYLIRRAADSVEVQQPTDGTVIPGCRARFGNPFTLAPEMASKIGRPEDAGKTVLAWAVVDKRGKKIEQTETNAAAEPNADEPNADEPNADEPNE